MNTAVIREEIRRLLGGTPGQNISWFSSLIHLLENHGHSAELFVCDMDGMRMLFLR